MIKVLPIRSQVVLALPSVTGTVTGSPGFRVNVTVPSSTASGPVGPSGSIVATIVKRSP